jgi:hypothetical protein
MSILQLDIIHPSQENLSSERLQSEAGTERKGERDEKREIAGECGG